MMLSTSHKFAFIHTPKTGGSSMTWALAPYCVGIDGKPCPQFGYRQRRRGWQGRTHYGPCHSPYARTKKHIPEGFFTFAFVRNPFEAAYSSWHRNFEGGLKDKIPDTFQEYIKQVINRTAKCHHGRWTQFNYLSDKGSIAVDFVGRFENLLEDWKTVIERIGLKDLFLPKLNQTETSDTKKYREAYTPKMIRLMTKRYAKDLEEFGYEF